ncbi:hypothetical protein Tco_0242132 [Tanacetum coccineum]
MTSVSHSMMSGDVEFQDNWGRVRLELRLQSPLLYKQLELPFIEDLNCLPVLDTRSGESSAAGAASRELGYGITDTWDDLVGAIQEIAPTTLEGVNQRVTELATTVDQEDDIDKYHAG